MFLTWKTLTLRPTATQPLPACTRRAVATRLPKKDSAKQIFSLLSLSLSPHLYLYFTFGHKSPKNARPGPFRKRTHACSLFTPLSPFRRLLSPRMCVLSLTQSSRHPANPSARAARGGGV